MLASYHKYLNWPGDTPEMILVGISYGTDDWRQGNRRSTDYTLPAEGRDHYGGAALFHRFLTEELMPWVERTYPADPNQRLLFGHSLGGQFALYCALFKPDTFAGIIASNPAIHNNTAAFMLPPPATESQPKLVVVQADGDDTRYQQARQQWLDYWQQHPHHWLQQVITVPGHNHMSSVPAAFRQGMMWLYPPKPTTTE
jgi:predicted alpha/beta superfamily hydrolase